MDVKITVIKGSNFRDFDNDRLIEGDRIIQGRLIQVGLYTQMAHLTF